MKPIATDTADFPQMRKEGKIYVDKTAFLYDLVSNANAKLFFISRPRRFGKSLMISTLKAIFEGRRELFDGLTISKADWYQAGYLTIRDYDPVIDSYTLGLPDEEIRRDFSVLMTAVAANKDTAWAASLGKQLLVNNWMRFFDGLKSLYAAMSYGSTEGRVHENSYGRCLSFLLASCGFKFRMEDVQSNGRADIVAEHVAGVYIFELKVDEPVANAFGQILEKDYTEPYKADGRPIWLIALSFDGKTRRLIDCAVKKGHE